ncbi:MAG: phosphotransferase family protein [Anaerolineae bacterium]|nr:phosphotransferase family protein [Anaerolineae bacterium]
MTTEWLDPASPVRPGEELNIAALQAYLTDHLPDVAGDLAVSQFPRGYSNLTYLLTIGKRGLVLRRPPFGAQGGSAHDMGREYNILSHLHAVYPKVPKPLLYCPDEAVIGAPFYVMERVEGVILRATMPPAMRPEPALMTRIAGAFVDNLADLHAVDYEAAGLGRLGRPAGYVERQIGGWTKRYARAKTDELPELDRTAAWLADHLPSESAASLIHNDYKYDNLILDPVDWATIIAVLDWEMATLGDPLMDLGTSLGYWVQADDPPVLHTLHFSPTTLPGNPSREALVERYARQSGRDIPDIIFYYVYGVFKLAVVIQQIYYRYKMGHTQDARFGELHRVVSACSQIAYQAIQKQRLDQLF